MKFFYLFTLLLLNVANGFYIPIATSLSVSKVAKSIQLSDATVVLARNSTGNAVAFHDFCTHRGASFDKVTLLENDSISCPYHGFVYNTKYGELESGIGVTKGCGHLKMVECVEKNGLVWVCLDGDNSLNPPELKEASDKNFRKISGSVTVKCPVENLIENVLDCLHISYLHSFGNRIEPEPLNYKASNVSDTRGVATFQYNTGVTSIFNGLADVKNWYEIPCTACTSVTSGKNVKIVVVYAVQLPNNYTKVFWELYRNWSTEHYMDSFFEMAMKITLSEDKEILEKCNFEKGDKFHGKYDKLQLLYRRSLKKNMPGPRIELGSSQPNTEI